MGRVGIEILETRFLAQPPEQSLAILLRAHAHPTWPAQSFLKRQRSSQSHRFHTTFHTSISRSCWKLVALLPPMHMIERTSNVWHHSKAEAMGSAKKPKTGALLPGVCRPPCPGAAPLRQAQQPPHPRGWRSGSPECPQGH